MSDAGARPAWGAVYAMALCVAVLIASEFMPVSLLSPIARDLGLTEGQAGQAISISGVFAVVTSLSITVLAGRLDRRIVLIALTTLLVVSGTIVAFAPNFLVLMIGRALLGVAIGGFWSMSAATVMRLVPAESVSQGLAIIYGGNAIATTIAAPLGSFMGGLIGWRGAFFCVVPLAVVAVIWQVVALPPLPAEQRSDDSGMLRLLRNRHVVLGLMAAMLLFMGQFALFTYLRPFLEQVTGVSVATLSVLLLIVGVAGFIGTALIGRVLADGLHLTLAVIPAIMAVVAVALGLLGTSTWITAGLLAVWGLVGTAAPVAWSTWLTRTLPRDAEAGGGLMVATIQLAITAGATIGGVVFDRSGAVADVLASAAVLALAALVAFVASRAQPVRHETIIQQQGVTVMDIKRSGTQASVKPPEAYFTGTVRLDPLNSPPDPARVAMALVTFEPGARTAWHTHPLGQTLIVTAGSGWAQREGGAIEDIRPGDVVWFPPGEKHWHGATATTAMSHIAIQEKLDGSPVDWLEKVTDAQYRR